MSFLGLGFLKNNHSSEGVNHADTNSVTVSGNRNQDDESALITGLGSNNGNNTEALTENDRLAKANDDYLSAYEALTDAQKEDLIINPAHTMDLSEGQRMEAFNLEADRAGLTGEQREAYINMRAENNKTLDSIRQKNKNAESGNRSQLSEDMKNQLAQDIANGEKIWTYRDENGRLTDNPKFKNLTSDELNEIIERANSMSENNKTNVKPETANANGANKTNLSDNKNNDETNRTNNVPNSNNTNNVANNNNNTNTSNNNINSTNDNTNNVNNNTNNTTMLNTANNADAGANMTKVNQARIRVDNLNTYINNIDEQIKNLNKNKPNKKTDRAAYEEWKQAKAALQKEKKVAQKELENETKKLVQAKIETGTTDFSYDASSGKKKTNKADDFITDLGKVTKMVDSGSKFLRAIDTLSHGGKKSKYY